MDGAASGGVGQGSGRVADGMPMEGRHGAGLKQVVSRCAVEEMARWLERAEPSQSELATSALPVVSAIAWHLRVGGGWRALPPSMPPWRTVYGRFRRWLDLGLFNRLPCDVACLRHRAAGRRGWASSTRDRSSASPCAVRAAMMQTRRCWGASARPGSMPTATGWPWPWCPPSCKTATPCPLWTQAINHRFDVQLCKRGLYSRRDPSRHTDAGTIG